MFAKVAHSYLEWHTLLETFSFPSSGATFERESREMV